MWDFPWLIYTRKMKNVLISYLLDRLSMLWDFKLTNYETSFDGYKLEKWKMFYATVLEMCWSYEVSSYCI